MNRTTRMSGSVEGGWLGWTLCDLAAARLSSCKVGPRSAKSNNDPNPDGTVGQIYLCLRALRV